MFHRFHKRSNDVQIRNIGTDLTVYVVVCINKDINFAIKKTRPTPSERVSDGGNSATEHPVFYSPTAWNENESDLCKPTFVSEVTETKI